MRYIFYFSFLFVLMSCNDGDFEVPTFEFNESIASCGNYVFYRTNSSKTEAIVLTIDGENITNEVSVDPIYIPISNENVQYRIFSEAIGTNYFCQDVPPVSPEILKNWVGISGSDNYISITTSEILNDLSEVTGYAHHIVLYNMVLELGDDQIIYETYNFGYFNTSI